MIRADRVVSYRYGAPTALRFDSRLCHCLVSIDAHLISPRGNLESPLSTESLERLEHRSALADDRYSDRGLLGPKVARRPGPGQSGWFLANLEWYLIIHNMTIQYDAGCRGLSNLALSLLVIKYGSVVLHCQLTGRWSCRASDRSEPNNGSTDF